MKVGDKVRVLSLDFKGRGGIPERCLLESGVVLNVHSKHRLPIEVLMDNEKLRSSFGKGVWVFPEDCVTVIVEWHVRKERGLTRRPKTL